VLKIEKDTIDSLITDIISEEIWEYNLLTGETNIVESLITYLGYTNFEIRSHIDFLFSLIHNDDIEYLANAFNELIIGTKDYFKAEYRIRTKNNEYILVKSKCKVLKDGQGKSIYIAGLHLDIKQYKKTEDTKEDFIALAGVNKKIIDLLPLGVYIISNGIITYANKPGLKLFGANCANDVVGKPRLNFIQDHCQDNALKRESKIIHGEEIETVVEMELKKVDGTKIIGEIYSLPFSNKDELFSLTYINDITEKKKMIEENKKLLEQAIDYDRLKTDFFSNLSHELRTPLNIILSGIQLLNSLHNDSMDNYKHFIAAFEKYTDIIRQNAYRLLKLINNILDITKIDTSSSEIYLENYNIVSIIEHITLSVVPYVNNKGLELIFDTDIEEKVIACNEDTLERIMLNLLSNAIKNTKSGGTINVDIKDLNTDVMISVQDTGIGIPNDKLDVIFERFRQVDELLTRRTEGSGIGLSLVKSLVEAHGGTISVSSTQGIGSEFVFLLPNRTVENTKISDKHLDFVRDDDQLLKEAERINIEFSDIYK